eukprot:ANDGO_01235.mRNA.1 Structural maintenance of chromosomes protein 3
MHIKSVTITGFKSYREPTAVHFGSQSNLVVGLNGSGKSNLFAALEFVLSDRYSSLSTEERRGLLHDGAGRSTLSASVTIVLDNTDGRIPIDKPTVAITRMVGLKSEEFRVDGKPMSSRDVTNLLETAGFSRSNPYYIVRQGEIEKLVAATDEERLVLLKEVAGTRVYDERRGDSSKLLAETEDKRKKVRSQLDEMDDRLHELDEERKDLAEYLQLENERKTVEYALADRKLAEARRQLDSVESERSAIVSRVGVAQDAQTSAQALRRDADSRMEGLMNRLDELEGRKRVCEGEKNVAMERKARLEVQLQRLHSESEHSNSQSSQEPAAPSRKRSRMQEIQEEIARVEKERDGIRDEIKQLEEEERSILQQRDAVELRMLDESNVEFEIKRQEEALKEATKNRLPVVKATVENYGRAAEKASEQVRALTDELSLLEGKQETQTSALQEKNEAISRTLMSLRNAQRAQDEASQVLRDSKETYSKAEALFNKTSSREVVHGLQSIKAIATELPAAMQRGVKGPLVDLVSPSADGLHLAFDVVGGNSLLFVVVDNDATAALLLKKFYARQAPGRVSFFPIAQLAANMQKSGNKHSLDAAALKREFNDDAVPFTEMLTYSKDIEPAVQTVFGRCVLCRTLDIAHTVSVQFGCDAVTLTGEFVSRKGFLKGGFVDKSAIKSLAARQLSQASSKRDSAEEQLRKAQDVVDKENQAYGVLCGDADRLRRELSNAKSRISQIHADLIRFREEEQRALELLHDARQKLTAVERDIQQGSETVAALRAKAKASKKGGQNTKAKDEEFERCRMERQRLDDEIAHISSQKKQLEQQLQKTKTELESRLYRERLSLLSASSVMSDRSSFAANDISQLEADLVSVSRQMQDNIAQLESIGDRIAKTRAEYNSARDAAEEHGNEEEAAASQLADAQRDLAMLDARRATALKMRDETVARIRELGTLPRDLENVSHLSTADLLSRLDRVLQKLKQYTGRVNRKAVDQWEQARAKRAEFEARLEEADRSSAAISELIGHLDQKKDETLHNTFRQVARNFSRVFEEVVPNGWADLVMKTGSVHREHGSIDSYTGVSIQCNFKSKKAAGSRSSNAVSLSHLSGGERSLLALCLIFAIQRCDPAPFYLFDEIDANLDGSHCVAVARMIQRLSRLKMVPDISAGPSQSKDGTGLVEDSQTADGSTQFICTSFKHQAVTYYDEVYCTSYANRVSAVDKISHEQAVALLQSESNEEQEQ